MKRPALRALRALLVPALVIGLAGYLSDRVVVEIGRDERRALRTVGHFTLEESLALLEARQLGGDHA